MAALIAVLAISFMVGLAVSMFAGAAILLTRAADTSASVDARVVVNVLLIAAREAGVPVSLTVLGGLSTIGAGWWIARQVRKRRDALRAIARSALIAVGALIVIAAIPVWGAPFLIVLALSSAIGQRVLNAIGTAIRWAALMSACACGYAVLALLGVTIIGESTRQAMRALDDATLNPTLALGVAEATAGMYVGLTALASCVFLAYRFLRPARTRDLTGVPK